MPVRQKPNPENPENRDNPALNRGNLGNPAPNRVNPAPVCGECLCVGLL